MRGGCGDVGCKVMPEVIRLALKGQADEWPPFEGEHHLIAMSLVQAIWGARSRAWGTCWACL